MAEETEVIVKNFAGAFLKGWWRRMVEIPEFEDPQVRGESVVILGAVFNVLRAALDRPVVEEPTKIPKQQYPEHEKLQAVKEESQAIGSFLDNFLSEKGYTICQLEEGSDLFWPIHRPINSMLAEYFGIDEERLETEKRQMIEEMREANSSGERNG